MIRRIPLLLCLVSCAALGVTQKYVDPSCTNNGDGTGQDCAASAGAAGAYNTLPTPVDNTTYSFRAGTTYSADGLNVSVGGSSASSRVTLNAYGTGAKPIIAPTNGGRSGNSILIGTNQAHVTIDGLDVRGPTGAGNIQTNAIRNNVTADNAATVTDIIVRNCNIQDVLDSHAATDDEDGIDLFGAQVQIRNNVIHNIANDAVWTRGEDDVIDGNRCSLVSQAGTSGDCYQVHAAGVRTVISNNYCDHTDKDTKQCIVSNAPNTVIKYNKGYGYVGGTTNTVILCDGDSCMVGPGNFTSGGAAGISLGSTNGVAFSNVCINSQSYTIDLGTSSGTSHDVHAFGNVVVRGSAMTNNGLSGIILRARAGMQAINNVVIGFGRGISEFSANSPTLSNNAYWENTTNLYDLTAAAAASTTNAVTTDPLLTGGSRPQTADGARLRAGSPLRRTGKCYLATGCVYPDFIGARSRVPPNIGAYQAGFGAQP